MNAAAVYLRHQSEAGSPIKRCTSCLRTVSRCARLVTICATPCLAGAINFSKLLLLLAIFVLKDHCSTRKGSCHFKRQTFWLHTKNSLWM